MKVIGLCGGSGSGKSVVSAAFAKRGFIAIDTDKVYRDLTDRKSHCLDELVCVFGGDILTEFGALNRAKLRDIVFADREKLKQLNSITHKYILGEVRSIISDAEKQGALGALVDAPLLYESGFDTECDYVVAVVADRKNRIARIMKRDNITELQATARIDSQIPNGELISKADFVIVNDRETQDIDDQVSKITRQII